MGDGGGGVVGKSPSETTKIYRRELIPLSFMEGSIFQNFFLF